VTPPDLARFVHEWAQAVIGTSYVSMDLSGVEEYLRPHANRLAASLSDEPFTPTAAHQVGAAMVAAHFTSPQTLNRTITVLPALLAYLEGDEQELRSRLHALQGGLAHGYASALRDRTLDEQEAIRRAAITALEQAEEAHRASEARFRAMFAGATIAIAIGDMQGRILEANLSLAEMLGYSVAELHSRPVEEFLHPEDVARVQEAYGELILGKRDHARADARFIRSNGGIIWAHLALSVVRDELGRPSYLVAMGEDVTDRQRLQMRLRHEAGHDPLTRLPNRALFSERLAQAFSDAGPGGRVGLCFIDLDGFKAVNDSLGHDVGDELLVAVSDRLDQSISRRNRLLARLGGDEFVIVISDSTGPDEVVAAADAALAAVARPVRIGGHELRVSASIGVVERPVATTDPAEIMRAADISLSWAKSDGKGRWALFNPERNAREVARYALAATMPAGLERGEFRLDYQPLFGLADGALLGVEALVRWRHPLFGLLTPGQFLELAEETGLIVPLGRWVLEQACRQAREWLDRYADAPFISVNVAVGQSRDAALVDEVVGVLGETGLDPGHLQLELTERAISEAGRETVDALRALSDMGVRIAVDDVAGGYGNLAQLRRLPISELKLPRSLLQGLRSADRPDPVDERVVATLVSVAHMLDVTVTAEGVENAAQADRLRAMGCDRAQGWFFGHPAPADDITRMLDAAHRG
jgi:diguanylate cyclase (GGDEF)-like protein/PAS domain S-box-containing protein